MKLHLPLFLRKSVLSCLALVAGYTLSSGTLAFADDLVLGAEDTLSIDYAAADSIPDLENGTLQLDGDALLQLLNCGSGDGKTYTLATGVSGLLDAQGNAISLDSTNNAISNYFDADRPGTGFWADSTLVLTDDGTLQLVRHDQAVKEAVSVTERQSNGANYQYYKGVSFENLTNTEGGAIFGDVDISLSNNGSVIFSGNEASSAGGAIYGDRNGITLDGNGCVMFADNVACYDGGAITYHDGLSIKENEIVLFVDNAAGREGGAIASYYGGFLLSNNGNVLFSGNTASSDSYAYGGAIYGNFDGTISLSGNGSVEFSGNSVSGEATVYGGAIYGGHAGCISLDDNINVIFSGNLASGSYAYGGAICGAGKLCIRNNDSVEFYKNAELENGTYRLRSIYVDGRGGTNSLSAAEGKSITFYDSVYIGSGATVNLNADYTDAEGKVHKQQGDIIFTGATTVDDLYEVKGNIAGTEEEILLSRTSEVYTMTNLYGGRLRVEDGAIYQGYGITAHAGSESTVLVKDATLSHSGYDLTFNAGTTLALAGANSITGNLNLLEGSTLHIDFAGNEFTTNLNGSTLELTGDAFLRLTSAGKGDGKTYTLFTGVSGLVDAEGNAISLDSTNNAISNYFDADRPGTGFWANGTLQLNNGALQMVLHNETVKEAITITTRQENSDAYQYYAGVRFENISNTSTDADVYGGAIYGDSDSTIELSFNGSVTFSGNTASSSDYYAYGGAIYGDNITFNNNGSVLFRENGVYAEIGSSTYGGAVYGSITLSDNTSVEFVENCAHGWTGGVGGAISGDATLSNNGRVEFYNNSAWTGPSGPGRGGAIDGDVWFSDNGSVVFGGNSVQGEYSGHSGTKQHDFEYGYQMRDGGAGGAICGSVVMTRNDSVLFTGNTISEIVCAGGAIYGDTVGASIIFTDNHSVEFSGNGNAGESDYVRGGAIYGGMYSSISFCNNGNVKFIGNKVSATEAYGGAIYTYHDLSIRNNESVLFEQNAEITDGIYRLRSIVGGGNGDVVSLSAAVGKSIEFRDSVYITSGSTVNLNEDYTYLDEEGVSVTVKQQGDIVFTGATTVDDLYDVKGNVAGTEEEIRLSRTTEVNTLTNLYGGRLRVEDGAIYQGQGITAHAGSDATVLVKDATLSHEGYDLTFNAGTTLELTGANTITGNVQMLEGSTMRLKDATVNGAEIPLSFNAGTTLALAGANSITGNLNLLEGSTLHIDFAGNEFTTNLNGSTLELTGDAFLRLTTAGKGDGKTYTLFTGVSGLVDAEGNPISLDSTNNAISNYFDANRPGTGFWADSTLVLTDDGTLQLVRHDQAVKEAVSVTEPQSNGANYQYYKGVSFENLTNTEGGAIDGGDISLHDNGRVEFIGNEAGSYGGAVYSGWRNIKLSNNDSLVFRDNAASDGGAITNYHGNLIEIKDNGSVEFDRNRARAENYKSAGGAIWATMGSFVLSGNESVVFSGNSVNTLAYDGEGGAISVGTTTICDNGSVIFSGNTVETTTGSAYSGAISSYDLDISNNDSVLFEKNAEITNGSYRLRSIYVGIEDFINTAVTLSAAEGGCIEIRDSVHIDSDGYDGITKLNADYTDENGEVHKQTGDIIFTGKYTEQHLNELLAAHGANREATPDEIRNSLCSVIDVAELYGGCLRVENGAQLLTDLDVLAGSKAIVRVKDATLAGYADFAAGTTLEIVGTSEVDYLSMSAGSNLIFQDSDARMEADIINFYGSGSFILESGNLSTRIIYGGLDVAFIGGSLELRDDMDALAGSGEVSISQSTLSGQWTADGLTIGGARVTEDADIKLNNLVISSTLSNEGNLQLGGLVGIHSEDWDSSAFVERHSAGDNGYRIEERCYTLVEGGGETSSANGVEWQISEDGVVLECVDYSFTNGRLTAILLLDGQNYWVNGAVTYDARSEFSTADTLVLNGGNLTMNANLGSNLTGGIRVDAASTLTLGAGVQVERAQLSGVTESNTVSLAGAGKLNLGSSADFTGYALNKDWRGTVKLENITTDTNLDMNTIGQIGSTIELENVMGYTGVNGGTVAADLQLNRSTAADGTEQAALVISNGYSHKTNADHVMTTFSGTVSGYGKMVYEKTLSNQYTGFAFSGDVSGWKGAFEMNGGKTFNLVFDGKATEINANISDISSDGTLNLKLGADAAMRVNGDVVTDSITVTNDKSVSFGGSVTTGTFSAANSAITLGANSVVSGDMTVDSLHLLAGSSLDVGNVLSAGNIELQNLSTAAPSLTVGRFAGDEVIFSLNLESVNALNLAHGDSVVLARADQALGSGFAAWLTSSGNNKLDAGVYRYLLSVNNTDVVLTMDYANWGTRVWFGNTWVGDESWTEFSVSGYDAVDGVETVQLGGATYVADALYIAPGPDAVATVLSNGRFETELTEVVDGRLEIAAGMTLDTYDLVAEEREVLLKGVLVLTNGQVGTLSGTSGDLTISQSGEVRIDSDVTLGKLLNNGTLDIGSHKLNVAGAVSTGGSVIAGEVEIHNRNQTAATFDALVADKVTVTNTSSNYAAAISLGDGSAIGELHTDKLVVHSGVVTLGRTAKQTEQELQSIALQKGADLVLQGQTSLSVTDSVAMTAGSEVQIQSGATLQNGAIALSAAPGTAAAQLSSKVGGDLVMMQQAGGLCIQDVLLVNTSISAAEGTAVMLSGVDGSENVHLLGGADFSLTFADNKADVGMAVIENSSPVTGITLSAGSTLTLVMDPTNNDFRDYSLVINMSGFEYEGGILAATGGITDLNAAGIYLGGWLGELLAVQGVVQEGVGNLESPEVPGDSIPTVSYTYNTDNNVGMIISINGLSVPEPTTTTLSLLALTALAMRRRRR